MPDKCKRCGARYIEYPIFEGQEDAPKGMINQFKYMRQHNKKLNWYNFIIGDWTKLLIYVMIGFIVLAYIHDTEQMYEIIENPCDFVDNNYQACQEIKQRQDSNSDNRYLIIQPEAVGG